MHMTRKSCQSDSRGVGDPCKKQEHTRRGRKGGEREEYRKKTRTVKYANRNEERRE
jgi:hypothetical protein